MKKIILLFGLLLNGYMTKAQEVYAQNTTIELCSSETGEIVDLTTDITTMILAGQNPWAHQVTFHETQQAAEEGYSTIENPASYLVVDSHTIYPRVTRLSDGEFAIGELAFEVLHLPIPAAPDPIVAIDYESDGIGIEYVDLTVQEIQMANGWPDAVFSYYTSFESVLNDDPIVDPNNFLIESSPRVIYVSADITNDSGCTSLTVFELIVILDQIPEIPDEIGDYEVYDQDEDGFAVFDLTSVIPGIAGTQENLTVTFYETETDAENKTNVIAQPESYQNITNPQTIYVRVETVHGTFALGSFVIFANPELGISENGLNKLQLFPNPVKDIIYFKSGGKENNVAVSLFSSEGKLLIDNTHSDLSKGINVSHLQPGIYFLKIESENGSVIRKVVKK